MASFKEIVESKDSSRDVIILIGDEAREVAESNWACNSPKLLLNELIDPEDVNWPVENRTAIVRLCGNTIKNEQPLKLVQNLLEAGALYVLVVYQNLEMMRFEPEMEDFKIE
ncbi:MAG: hypothetical protein IBX56_06010 [Methylomicrobium sp.]|nr:hypothetical protein [Methylomicrobium sp.]